MIEKSEWRDWLATAAKASGKSLRAISLESGNNPGYLHSILATDRDPTVQNLIGICDTIGGSVVSILCEYKLTAEDMEILDALHKSPEVRAGILAILKAQSGSYR